MEAEFFIESETKLSYDGDQYSGWENDDPDEFEASGDDKEEEDLDEEDEDLDDDFDDEE